MNPKAQLYKREDGKWAWRLVASNGQIIATDGGQGYENRADAAAVVFRLAPHAEPDAEPDDD